MKSMHTIEIEVEWLDGARYAVADRRISGNHIQDPRTKSWWDDDGCILIERPRPEPRFRAYQGPRTLTWYVGDKKDPGWVAAFETWLPDAERHAREFADLLNREAEE